MIVGYQRRIPWTRRALAAGAAALAAAALAACGSGASGASGSSDGYDVKLGYFPNITHASAIVGIDKGYFEDSLAGDGATLTTQTFNSGSDTVNALLNGGLDATYIGPSPSLVAYVQSKGEAVRVVSGAASGGASLIVQPDIGSVADLQGKKVATPGLANTQDVAAKAYFKQQGFTTDEDGGGDIPIVNQDNSVTVQAFKQGDIAGAWVPEPYASILEAAGGKKLVDEADLWPKGQFVTTQLLVRKEFLDQHPDLVADLVLGQVKSNAFINENTDDAKTIVRTQLTELTQSDLGQDVVDSAWKNLTFTDDPIASSLEKDAKNAEALGLLNDLPDVTGIYDLDPLKKAIPADGQDPVEAP